MQVPAMIEIYTALGQMQVRDHPLAIRVISTLEEEPCSE